MPREWKARPAPKPTTITEVARRYHACAAALARSLGLPLTAEFLQIYHAAIAAVYIEASRAGVRLPASVKLPPLPEGPPEQRPDHQADSEPPASNGHGARPPAVPTSIPSDGDLPCAGQEIATLKPAALAMLLAKTATLAHAEGAGWAPLLHALQSERVRRLAQGRRPLAVVPPPDGGIDQESSSP